MFQVLKVLFRMYRYFIVIQCTINSFYTNGEINLELRICY